MMKISPKKHITKNGVVKRNPKRVVTFPTFYTYIQESWETKDNASQFDERVAESAYLIYKETLKGGRRPLGWQQFSSRMAEKWSKIENKLGIFMGLELTALNESYDAYKHFLKISKDLKWKEL